MNTKKYIQTRFYQMPVLHRVALISLATSGGNGFFCVLRLNNEMV
jgi:hypothetical protein